MSEIRLQAPVLFFQIKNILLLLSRCNKLSLIIQVFDFVTVLSFSMTWDSFKRLAIVAQKTAKASLNAARTAVTETYKQNKIRAEAAEAREVRKFHSIECFL